VPIVPYEIAVTSAAPAASWVGDGENGLSNRPRLYASAGIDTIDNATSGNDSTDACISP